MKRTILILVPLLLLALAPACVKTTCANSMTSPCPPPVGGYAVIQGTVIDQATSFAAPNVQIEVWPIRTSAEEFTPGCWTSERRNSDNLGFFRIVAILDTAGGRSPVWEPDGTALVTCNVRARIGNNRFPAVEPELVQVRFSRERGAMRVTTLEARIH